MRIFLAFAIVAGLLAASPAGAQQNRIGAPPSDTPYQGAIKLPRATVGTLPLCDQFSLGIMRVVTDATGLAYNGTVTAGGATVTSVLCNGTNWVAH